MNCKRCDEPFTPAQPQRGSPRQYCSEVCRKRAEQERLAPGKRKRNQAERTRRIQKRLEQFLASDRTCPKCGFVAQHPCQLDIDHIIPKRAGGKDEPSNRQTLCANCHRYKTWTDLTLHPVR